MEGDKLASVQLATCEAMNAFIALKGRPESRYSCVPTGSSLVRLALHRAARAMNGRSEFIGVGDFRYVVMWIDAESLPTNGVPVIYEEFEEMLSEIIHDIFDERLSNRQFHHLLLDVNFIKWLFYASAAQRSLITDPGENYLI